MGGTPPKRRGQVRFYEEIRAINDGNPHDPRAFFRFLRGGTVRKGAVDTLRSVLRDCYAKVEITDVTLAPNTGGN